MTVPLDSGNAKLYEARDGQLDAGDAYELVTYSLWFLYKGVHGALATIETQDELDFIVANVLEDDKDYWIGASSTVNPGAWTWLTGRNDVGSLVPSFITSTLGENTNNWGCLTISKSGVAYADCDSEQNFLVTWQCPSPRHYFGANRCEGVPIALLSPSLNVLQRTTCAASTTAAAASTPHATKLQADRTLAAAILATSPSTRRTRA